MTNTWMQLLHMLRLLWQSHQQRGCTGYYVMHGTRATLGLCRFSAQWNRLHRHSCVHSIIDFFADFSQNFSERALSHISITKIGILEPVTPEKPCLFHADFNHDFNHDFLHSGTLLLQLCRFSNPTFTTGASHNNVAYAKDSPEGYRIRLDLNIGSSSICSQDWKVNLTVTTNLVQNLRVYPLVTKLWINH